MTLVMLGQLLELSPIANIGCDQGTAGLAPKTALRIEPTAEEEFRLTHVNVGDGCGCGQAKRCRSTAK